MGSCGGLWKAHLLIERVIIRQLGGRIVFERTIEVAGF
jgi:hypothetical protein